MKRATILLVMTIAIAVAASAQSHIEGAIKTVERSKTTQNEVFSERRDPNSGKIIRVTRLMDVSNNDAARLIKAFDSDRTSSTNYDYIRNKVYTIKFVDKDGSKSYSLCRDGQKWRLSVDIRNDVVTRKQSKRRVSYNCYDTNTVDIALPTLPELPELPILPELPELPALPEMPAIDIDDSGITTIYYLSI